jgi:hypothetical protein
VYPNVHGRTHNSTHFVSISLLSQMNTTDTLSPHFMNPNVHGRAHNSTHFVPIKLLSQMNTANTLPAYSFKIHFNVHFPLRLGRPRGLFPSDFPPKLYMNFALAASCACLHPVAAQRYGSIAASPQHHKCRKVRNRRFVTTITGAHLVRLLHVALQGAPLIAEDTC